MSIKITYFAHGTTLDNEAGISSGWHDAELSELGVRQVTELQEQTKNMEFDEVFSSDQSRAFYSAKFAFGDRFFNIITDQRLRECNYGKLNAAPSSVVEPMCENECIYNKFPEGESYEDVAVRVADFLEFLKKNYDGKSIALFTHKAPQLAFDVLIKGKTWGQALREDWRKNKSWQPGWDYQLN